MISDSHAVFQLEIGHRMIQGRAEVTADHAETESDARPKLPDVAGEIRFNAKNVESYDGE
jgi:hypothetical protein